MSTQRAHPRHSATIKLKIAFPDLNEFQTVYSKNISKGGMFLATPNPLGQGTRVTVRLWPPGVNRPFDLEGEIAHSVDTPTAIKQKCTPGMGIRFTNLNVARKAALDLYIKELLAGKTPAEPPPDDEGPGRSKGRTRPRPRPVPAPRPSTGRSGQTAPYKRPDAPAAKAAPAAKPQASAGTGVEAAKARIAAARAKPAAAPKASPDAGKTMPLPHPAVTAPSPEVFMQRVEAAIRRITQKNHYEFFDVEPSATRDEIRRSYNRLAMLFHPDRAPAGLTPEQRSLVDSLFSEIGLLFEKLSVARTRVTYDLSVGINREPEDEDERLVLLEERARFREAYLLKYPDRIRQAERFAQMAAVAARDGDRRSAANNFKLALSLDPLNDGYAAQIESLKE